MTATRAPSTTGPSTLALGTTLVVLSAVLVGVVPGLAKLAYDGGSDPLTLITLRGVALIGFMLVGARLLGRSLSVARRPLLISLAVGLLSAATSYGFLASVAFIPVSLAILVFFLYPLIVAVLMGLSGRERVRPAHLAAFVVALAGLGLAVGVSWAELNLLGVGLAFVGAVACALMIIGTAIAARETTGVHVTFYMVISATLVMGIGSSIVGEWALPRTALGWGALLGVVVGWSIGLVAFFAAVPMLGPSRASMMSNIEPVVGVLFATLALGESLSPLQAAGMITVLATILALELVRLRESRS